jgi:hypothetical protein
MIDGAVGCELWIVDCGLVERLIYLISKLTLMRTTMVHAIKYREQVSSDRRASHKYMPLSSLSISISHSICPVPSMSLLIRRRRARSCAGRGTRKDETEHRTRQAQVCQYSTVLYKTKHCTDCTVLYVQDEREAYKGGKDAMIYSKVLRTYLLVDLAICYRE